MSSGPPFRLPTLNACAVWLLFLLAAVSFARVQQEVITKDFSSYFFAAKAAQLGHSAYDYPAASMLAEAAGVERYYPYIYPPPLAHLLESLPLGDVLSAQTVWGCLMVCCYIGMLIMLCRLLGVRDGERLPEPVPGLWLFIVVAAAWVLVRAAREDFLNGQINCLIAFLSVSALYFSEARRFRWAGAALALAVLFKITPIVLGLYLLLRRQHLTLVWAAVFGAVLIGADVAGFGTADWVEFRRLAGAAGYAFPPLGIESFDESPASLPSLFNKLLGPTPIWIARATLGALLAMATTIAWFGLRGIGPNERGPAYGACALLAMLSAPLVWNHHFVALVPVLALLAQHVYLQFPRGRLRLLCAGAALGFVALPWERRLVTGIAEDASWRLALNTALNDATLFAVFVLCIVLWAAGQAGRTSTRPHGVLAALRARRRAPLPGPAGSTVAGSAAREPSRAG